MIESCIDAIATEEEKRRRSCAILHSLFHALSHEENLNGMNFILFFLYLLSSFLYLYLIFLHIFVGWRFGDEAKEAIENKQTLLSCFILDKYAETYGTSPITLLFPPHHPHIFFSSLLFSSFVLFQVSPKRLRL